MLDIKNLLVTGGCGFIGTNFIRWLLEQKEFQGRIINLDCLTYAGNPANLAGYAEGSPDRYVFVKGSITDGELLQEVFDHHEIDAVCHFAAETHVDRSIAKPAAFIETNIIGTFHLLETSLRQKGFLRFHHVSTDEVFGSLGRRGRFREKTAYRPNSPYSASKASSDHLVRAYHHTYGLPVTISNCSNNYGPYQFPEKLLPLMILNGLEEKPLPVYGDGRNVRDWLYVVDHCRAVWAVMSRGRNGRTYAIGGDNERENLELIEQICDLLDEIAGILNSGPRRKLIRFVRDRPGHDRRYAIDSTRIQKELGWTPLETMESGLRKSIHWYLTNRAWLEQVRTGDYRTWIELHYGTQT